MGFKPKIDKEKYLNAVRRAKSTSDKEVGERIGIDRSAVFRFRKKNPTIRDEAQAMLDGLDTLRFDSKSKPSYDTFAEIPIIADWIDMQWKVGEAFRRANVNNMLNVCHELRTHPEKITLEQCSELVKKVRKRRAVFLTFFPYP